MQTEIKLPPHNGDAEKSVIGAMLRNNSCIGDVIIMLAPEDFYIFANELVYRIIRDCFMNRIPADPVTVADILKKDGRVKDVGYGYLVEIWEAAPSVANVAQYAKIVRSHSIQREVIKLGREMIDLGEDPPGPIEEVIESAEGKFFAIAQKREYCQAQPLPEIIRLATARIEDQMGGNHDRGVPTGWVKLDAKTAGLHRGELAIVAARPSVGKTSWGLNLFYNIAIKHNYAAAFFSLEQSKFELAERLLCLHGLIQSSSMRHRILDIAQQEKLGDAEKWLCRYEKSMICDSPGISMMNIVTESRRLKMRHDIRIILVDYLQLVIPEDRRLPRHEQVAAMSRRFKTLARELDIPIVVLAQLNRNSDGQRPKLADLRESGAIEQDADTVFLLHNAGQNNPEVAKMSTVPLEVIVAKQRNGPTGDVTLMFRKEFMKFENAAEDDGRNYRGDDL